MARSTSVNSGLWGQPTDGPIRKLLEEALKEFRQSPIDRGIYKSWRMVGGD